MEKKVNIEITYTNKEQIISVLEEINGKIKNDILTFEELIKAVDFCNKKIDTMLVKHRKKFFYHLAGACQKLKSYKYSFEGVDAIMFYNPAKKAWILKKVFRKTYFPNQTIKSFFYWNLEGEKLQEMESDFSSHLLKRFLNN